MTEENKEQTKDKKTIKKKRTLFHRVINVFLYICLGIFAVLIIAFGVSQTRMFKNWLKDFAVEQVNGALNGKLSIEKIDGTIFTSIYLRHPVLTLENDTLLNVESIEVRISPLQLLRKRIFVRKFEIKNGSIEIIKNDNGELNISNLVPPAPEDTTTSEFPFTIEIADFKLTDIDFRLQRRDLKGSTENYQTLNMDDFRSEDINLSLNAFADINNNRFEAAIHYLNINSNINDFDLNNFSGEFIVNPDELSASGLSLQTDLSSISITCSLKDFNLFDSTSILKNSNLQLSLEADKFHFSDLEVFVPATDILRGEIYAALDAEGPFDSLNINELEIGMPGSKLATVGKFLNLSDPENSYIIADFNNTYIDQADVYNLLPSLNLPRYPELGVIRFDTLKYAGKFLNFNTNAFIKTDKGSVHLNGSLNLEKPQMQYDASFSTLNLDISPFTNIPTNLNLRGSIKGAGVNPKTLNADINIFADGSVIDANRFDTLRISADANESFINYNLLADFNNSTVDLIGDLNFENEDSPAYTIKGAIQRLNLSDFSKDTTLQSSINLSFDIKGDGFDPDKMNLFASLLLNESSLNDIRIDSTRAIVDLSYEENGERIVNFVSELADITLTGQYSITQITELLQSEAGLIANVIDEKLRELNFNKLEAAISKQATAISVNSKVPITFPQIVSPINLNYFIELKNFDLLSAFMGDTKLDVDGYLTGKIKSNSDSISVSINTTIEYLKYLSSEDVFFFTDLQLNTSITNSLQAKALDDIYLSIDLDTKRIFLGNELKNLSFNLALKNRIADINFYVDYEEIAYVKFIGMADLKSSLIKLDIDSLSLRYDEFDLVNKGNLKFAYSGKDIIIEQFVLSHDPGTISLEGALGQQGDQTLRLQIDNLRGSHLSTQLLGLTKDNSLYGSINVDSRISGNFADPTMDIKLQIDSISYKKKNLGSLTSNLNYKNENLKVDVRFIDSLVNLNKPALFIAGDVPINLAISGAKERLINSRPIDIKLTSEEFNLSTFGDLLPAVNNIRGMMTAGLTIGGTYDHLQPEGFLEIRDAAFIVEANNLEYNAGLKVNITEDQIILDSLTIANVPGTKNGGSMTGSGRAYHNNFQIASTDFSVNGQLKILDETSKSASPVVYGELVIASRGNIELQINDDRRYLSAPVTIKTAKLTFPPTQASYQNASEKFIYIFVEDTASDKGELSFEQLIELTQERNRSSEALSTKNLPFDFSIDVVVEDEAKIIFVLSKELNQNLTAVLGGNFIYESINNNTRAIGELKLLDGSTLQFLTKTFIASGTVKFENDLTNPYLDVTATYRDYYYPAGDSTSASNQEVEVAVKIKIKGALEDLGQNFLQGENNIAIYRGTSNIENNEPDLTLNSTDAVMFILTGSFTTGATQQQRNQAAQYATSLAGSIVGGFLNEQFGEYIRSVELRQVGTTTKFNVVGRAGEFRYSIGGSTAVFQDLSYANIKIEYPIIKKLFLRLERREAITTNDISNEMVNELGLRYKFEF